MQKLKNNKPRPRFTGSYIKKQHVYRMDGHTGGWAVWGGGEGGGVLMCEC